MTTATEEEPAVVDVTEDFPGCVKAARKGDYLRRSEKVDGHKVADETRRLQRKTVAERAALDGLLLKAAQADDDLAEDFMRIAKGKRQELKLLEGRIADLEAGKTPDGRKAADIIELAQGLAEKFVALPDPQKRQIVDSVLLNLRLDHTSLAADYRLPFSILAENGNRPANSGRLDLNQRPLRPERSALAKLSYAPWFGCRRPPAGRVQ